MREGGREREGGIEEERERGGGRSWSERGREGLRDGETGGVSERERERGRE